MDSVMTLLLVVVVAVIFLVVCVISGAGVALVICGIHMRVKNENNKIDYYNNYIASIPVQLIKSCELKKRR